MKIDSIQNGYVLDHIPAGKAMRIYDLLGLSRFDTQIALIQNAKSNKMGKKDVLKIATEDFSLDLDAVAYIAPGTTVNVIRDGKACDKLMLKLPKQLVNIVKCPNPRCISNNEVAVDSVFTLVDSDTAAYRCEYCETKAPEESHKA